ncbi:serine/threonine-protein kinase [Streptomyces colonosanans]|uniref:Serine/threonine protein kinase n=1 Tax=Streptomyces colonosanans TaxID=1428652 RepID=A0A1S2Q1V0_9ACTN|nr:serine/threonine-protein kinase [Streptomyces colonosanans]OIK00088.1 serine/threonine protein kinase [Streptomyces colonosanans]
MQPLEAGEPIVVGPYRLLGRLGSGGMGRVYLGRSAGGRTVAVKVVHPHFALDEEFRARFRREVEAARRVGGAWTAPVLDADPQAPVPWVATGYAAGPSLAAAVADGGPLPTHSVRALGAGLAEALTAVHGLGLVHRDVKPSNVLLTLDGPLLIDFGIARAIDGTASLTSTGVSIGSPGYMSPEQILGKGVTGAADVFSLGAVLAYAATGESPFPGDSSAALLYKVVHEEPELGLLEGEVRELVAVCLAKDPAARPAPAEVARRLAPQGAAGLVTGGWLPGPLVEQVSRSAVHLLNLEVTEATPSGPVGFSRASTGEVPWAPAGVPPTGDGSASASDPSGRFGPPPAGVFGPPPDMAAPKVPPAPVPQARPSNDASPADGGPGKLSVSVAATSAPGAGGRGRRVSCTVALVVAGALAAVTIGSAFVSGLFDNGSSSQGGDSSPLPDSSSVPSGDGRAGGVPAAYLGTWEGEAKALGGTLPAGTFHLTVHRAAAGEEFGTLRQTDQLGGICEDVLILDKATKTQLAATSMAKATNRAVCTKGRHTVRLTPVGDDLKVEMQDSDAGNPTARLTKIK